MALGWIWWRAWSRLVARGAAALCVAGVALGDVHLRFAWQVWHLAKSTFHLRGRRGTYGTGLDLVARLVPVGRPGAPALSVAGVALADIHLRFVWRRGTYGTGLDLVACLVPVGRPGRRGAWQRPPSFCVAGVALGDTHLRFAVAWQLWHLLTLAFAPV